MKQVQISDRTIEVDGRRLRLDYPVKDAFCEGDRILVLFEPDAASKTFPSCVSISRMHASGRPSYRIRVVRMCTTAFRPGAHLW